MQDREAVPAAVSADFFTAIGDIVERAVSRGGDLRRERQRRELARQITQELTEAAGTWLGVGRPPVGRPDTQQDQQRRRDNAIAAAVLDAARSPAGEQGVPAENPPSPAGTGLKGDAGRLDMSPGTCEPAETTTQGEQVLPSPDKNINNLFASLPAEPRQRLEAVPALYGDIRKAAAQALQPAVAAVVAQAAQLDYDQMAALAQVVNQALRAAQLGIRDPETGFPAALKPSRPRPSSPTRWLRLQDHWRGPGGHQNAVRLDQLPSGYTLELVPVAPEVKAARQSEPPSPSR